MNTTGDRSRRDSSRPPELEIRAHLARQYADIYTPDVFAALNQLAPFNNDQRMMMEARIRRRAARARNRQAIGFLDPEATIPRTQIKVKEARKGAFVGSEIPLALQRQWIQGTGPRRQTKFSPREKHPLGGLRVALRSRRLDVRWRRRSGSGIDHVAG